MSVMIRWWNLIPLILGTVLVLQVFITEVKVTRRVGRLFVENMNIPDSVVDNAQGFIDNNLDFVDNDDDAILDDNVEDALEVPVPEVLDKVMVSVFVSRGE
jgi:hypothetical protein